MQVLGPQPDPQDTPGVGPAACAPTAPPRSAENPGVRVGDTGTLRVPRPHLAAIVLVMGWVFFFYM